MYFLKKKRIDDYLKLLTSFSALTYPIIGWLILENDSVNANCLRSISDTRLGLQTSIEKSLFDITSIDWDMHETK